MLFTEKNQPVTVLAPDADRDNLDPSTDIVNCKLYGHVTFIVAEGAGGTGTATITANACEDVAGTNPEAIAFGYKVTSALGTYGELQAATASGYLTIAGANKDIAIEIEAAELPAGKPCVFLTLTEAVDDPVDAYVQAIMSEPRYASSVLPDPLVD